MNIVIRQVQQEDNLSLSAMIKAVFEEYGAPKEGTVYSDPTTNDLFSLFQKQGSILWVAAVDGKAKGCCGIYPTEGLPKKCAELVKFYLSAEIRGMGIGKQLMEKAVASAKTLGYQSLYLESVPEYAKAVQIYKKMDFQHLDHPLGNSHHFNCDIWMMKKL